MIQSNTQIVDSEGRPTRELLKALKAPIIQSVRIVQNSLPTRAFSLYAQNQGIHLPPHVAITTADGKPTREFLKSGLLA